MTITDFQAMDPAARLALFLEQVGLRYNEGTGSKALGRFADEFGYNLSTVYRWKEKPENLPFTGLALMIWLNAGEDQVQRMREKTVLAELDRAYGALAELADRFRAIARRVQVGPLRDQSSET